LFDGDLIKAAHLDGAGNLQLPSYHFAVTKPVFFSAMVILSHIAI